MSDEEKLNEISRLQKEISNLNKIKQTKMSVTSGGHPELGYGWHMILQD
jgi:hypothetical protein